MTYAQAVLLLREKGQEQLFKYYDELDEQGKSRLLSSLENIDWSFSSALNRFSYKTEEKKIEPIDGIDLAESKRRRSEFETAGLAALKAGKVAAVLLAGGQGTRLGWDGPKGTYDIGETKPLYIFECQFKNLLSVSKRCGKIVPLYIMTSDKTHEKTVAFLKEHDYFGYSASDVRFFMQEMSPTTDFNGKILLEEKDMPSLSPNGNGGWYSSFCKAGCDKDAAGRGAEWLNVYAVDNVLQQIADPVFVGATILSGVHCGAKVVRKNDPYEKVGVICLENGRPNIVEYYELNDEMANRKRADGSYAFCYGAIMNYLFRMQKLYEIDEETLPVHVVKKKIRTLDENGNLFEPNIENGYKFEKLAVDLIKPIGSVLPFEVDREKEFAPIKNATGTDSVESARALLKKNGVEL